MTDRELDHLFLRVASGGVDLSFGKAKFVLACFHVHSTIPTDLAACGGLFELTAELQKIWST